MTITVEIDHKAYNFTQSPERLYLSDGVNTTARKMRDAEDAEMSITDLFFKYGRGMAVNL